MRVLSTVALSALCATLRNPAASATATIASATRTSTSVKPRRRCGASAGRIGPRIATRFSGSAVSRSLPFGRVELDDVRFVAAAGDERQDCVGRHGPGPRRRAASRRAVAGSARGASTSSSDSAIQLLPSRRRVATPEAIRAAGRRHAERLVLPLRERARRARARRRRRRPSRSSVCRGSASNCA